MTQHAAQSPTNIAASSVPLCVDLDGTLIRTDILTESILLLLKKNPLDLFRLPIWLLSGKANLKSEVARRTEIDVTTLPYNADLLAHLRELRAGGTRLVLATSAFESIAHRVAQHLGIFDDVVATDDQHNLTGPGKTAALVQKFGEKGFDYAGNEAVDLDVWKHARRALVVGPSSLAERASKHAPVDRVLPAPKLTGSVLARTLRIHQWSKNLLLFVPLITGHQLTSKLHLTHAIVGFAAFCLTASAVYITNDLLDIPVDRRTPGKKNRPLAAGNLSIKLAMILALLCVISAAAAASLLPHVFALVLVAYFALSLSYSIYFKRKLLLDVYFLGGLYTIRVIAGSAATLIRPSAWLLAFAMFLFFSLALVKRFAELQKNAETQISDAHGRNYRVSDQFAIAGLGTSSGFLSVLVLALYINSAEVLKLYHTPDVLWLLCPLFMYWISRVWLIAFRGAMNIDPVLFALRDKVSYLTGLCAAIVILAARIDWNILR
ncbi:MAG TPA: UbiA family prenyltransferase [Tepidisphaeraceae bacterium]